MCAGRLLKTLLINTKKCLPSSHQLLALNKWDFDTLPTPLQSLKIKKNKSNKPKFLTSLLFFISKMKESKEFLNLLFKFCIVSALL